MRSREQNYHLRSVVVTFLMGGAIGAGLFTWFITRPSFKQVWFTKAEWWTFPTTEFWILTGSTFFVGVVLSCLFAVARGWLRLTLSWYRVVLATALAAAVPTVLSFLSKPNTAILAIFLSPFVVALSLSAALWLLTSTWHKWATVLVVIVYFAAPVIADVPELFLSGRYHWFDPLTFFIRSAFLTALCGWWLAKATQL